MTRLRIGIDCRYVRIGRHDGISRFTAGVAAHLPDRHDAVLLVSDERQLDSLPAGMPWELVPAPTDAGEPLVARHVNRLGLDAVFSPMQTMGSRGRRYALVLTLHDLIYYRNRTPPREFSWPLRLGWRAFHLAWWPQRFLLNGADGVVTVSETTAGLIAEHRLTDRPVTVAYNAADPAEPRDADAPRQKSLVYMGSFMPYKNVETLAAALPLLGPDWTLHCMSRVSDADRARLSGLAPAGAVVFHDGASDEEYRAVLRSATALATASYDEGFGIPLVESMGVGTPVVVSDIPIFREIGGDVAEYFDPSSPSAVAAAVRRLEARWDAASQASVAQAARFRWQDSAEQVVRAVERAVADREARHR
ncbi:glycosyltransferase family 4 protein [Curtobacterium herbarum]|uniref:D-inositol 3-phosphate glycosyltransferase n=1 Tax=Curtobacterium herbarum TaxID=150122 RepID=A0ABP4K1E3_9MICO|nr:glycosyltransferase family 1 protein [Curtobacterium herbarum]MBM7475370.1 glycosyltransferase involved in cell wall biosynthesis [Curtobacterium herbarum]MCS6543286.1 glycosyltransferase family 4 protein [Curtobacterium herbarum]